MAGTKARRPSPEVIDRRVKQGYGQGEGAGFKPFLFVRDVPSMGTSNMVRSAITGRVHHYMSRQEFKVHLLAEYSPLTLDIREEFALLPWEETQAIAQTLGIKHPRYPTTVTPVVMTTDLLLSLKRPDGVQLIAVCVKLTKDMTPRVMEKLLLVAEDDGHSLVMMLHVLKGRGYLTAFATDGDEAVRLAKEERPDLVVCKWRLSGADGRHTILQLRREKRLRGVPIIAVFDASLQVVGGRATPAGCADHLTEPIDPASFVTVVDQHIVPARRPARIPVPLRGRRRRADRTAPM